MKKMLLVFSAGLICLGLMWGCSAKNKETKKSGDDSTLATKNKIKEETADSTTTGHSEEIASVKKDAGESDMSSGDSSKAKAEAVLEILSGYSDLQIEYARVWLAVMGENFIPYMSSPDFDFNLNVAKIKAGSPIDQYDQGSVSYPEDVTVLSGNMTVEGHVIYSSNHNGTITQYNVPSHWHIDEPYRSDEEYIRQITQKIVDERHIVEIPAGDPALVRQLIEVMVIH